MATQKTKQSKTKALLPSLLEQYTAMFFIAPQGFNTHATQTTYFLPQCKGLRFHSSGVNIFRNTKEIPTLARKTHSK